MIHQNEIGFTVNLDWLKKWREFSWLITPILKSLVVPVIWLALIGAIYSRIPPFLKVTQSRITFDIQSLFFGAKRVIKTKREDERYLVLFMGILIFEDSWISFVPSTVVIFLFIGPLLQWLCHLKSFLICTNDCSLPLSDDQGVGPGAWGLRLRPTDPRPPDLRTSPSLTKNSYFRP